MTNYYEQLGELVLGSYLRKISERMLLEIAAIYKAENIDFEPGWFHTLFLLSQREKMSITELANTLQVSHPSIIQVIKALESKQIVETDIDPEDRRKRLIRLSNKGISLVRKVKPIWENIRLKTKELLNEGKHSKHLIPALKELEDRLNKTSLLERSN